MINFQSIDSLALPSVPPKQRSLLPKDRVKGLYAHKNKIGTVISVERSFVCVRWDGGKRCSNVQIALIEKIDEGDRHD